MLNLCNLSDEQFSHILDILILYNQLHPNKVVYLNEKCIKEALHFMNSQGKDIASRLGMNTEDN